MSCGNLEMLCYLVRKCGISLSYAALRLIVHYWEDVPASSGAAEGLLIHYLMDHANPLSIVSAILKAIRSVLLIHYESHAYATGSHAYATGSHAYATGSLKDYTLPSFRSEIQDRQKKKPTSHLEAGLERFGNLQLAILDRIQELMRGSGDNQGEKLLRLLAVLDPKPEEEEDKAAAGRGDHIKQQSLTLCQFRPLRVAFSDSDSAFMASPLVETFTRMAWMGQEYVMVG